MKKLPLTQGGYTLVDDEDYYELSKWKWQKELRDGKYYARRGTNLYKGQIKQRSVHRYVMKCPKGMVVDHINGDTLDNRKSNLRICTQLQNNYNRRIYKNSTTGYKGVVIHKSGKYRASIQINNKRISLGLFNTAEEAYNEYLRKSKELYGDFASKLTRNTTCV